MDSARKDPMRSLRRIWIFTWLSRKPRKSADSFVDRFDRGAAARQRMGIFQVEGGRSAGSITTRKSWKLWSTTIRWELRDAMKAHLRQVREDSRRARRAGILAGMVSLESLSVRE